MPSRKVLAGLAAGALAIAAALIWFVLRAPSDPPEGFARTNGRIEAERVDIATKFPGRLKSVLVKEGDLVKAGQVLAQLDTAELEAQLKEAEASKVQAEQQLAQAVALVAQRDSELRLATLQLERSLSLVSKGVTSQEIVDQRESAKRTAEAAVNSANAEVAVAKAAIEAAAARINRLAVDIDDSSLKAPRNGRVEYRLALPGEVLAAGGRVLTVLDLTDVYMTVFFPTNEAGRLRIGSEARVIFDAAPQYVVPATVTFVASEAQFTPKYVETKIEREKLMFRVKLSLPAEILAAHENVVKTGVPGVGYVKLSEDAVWPKRLSVTLPQ
ncbi:HlyD family secretion protein [Hyphomicrobium sp.]|jgi:HlyD family secretion protein|uniref:HlyD family secretion protein n=1 Tax=Hyphomicrobium sp. TaxID=82 RepID=UPI002FDF3978